MQTLTPKRMVLLTIATALLSLKMLSCDGADLGCEGGGFETLPWGAYPVDEKIDNLGQVRLTQGGIQFLEQNFQSLLEAVMPGGLTFNLESGSLGLCSYCPDGCPLTLAIHHIQIRPILTDTLEIKIYLPPDLDIRIPTSCCIFGNCCGVSINTGGRTVEITVLVQARIDGDTRMLDLVVNRPMFDIEQINVNLNNWCDALGLGSALVNTIKNILKPIIEDQVQKAVTDAVEGFKCVSCEDEPCPSITNPDHPMYGENFVCDDKQICRRENNNCLLTPLGIEAEVDVGALAASVLPDLKAKMWLSLLAGGRAAVIDNGLEIGMFGGSLVPPGMPAPCTEEVEYPVTPLERIPVGNLNEHVSPPQPYHASVGIREELLDQVGYTLQNSGLLCLTIDDSMPGVGNYLSLSNFALAGMGSLKRFIRNENAAAAIKLEPGLPLDFAILDQATAFPDNPEMDVALRINIKDLKLHFHGLIDERWYRVFTLQVDIEVTAGLDVDGAALQPVFGLDNVKISNYRIPYSALAETPADIASGLDSMLGSILGQIPLEPFEPIEIPGFDINGDDLNDLYIDIDALAPEMPKTYGTPTEYKALVVYASLVQANPDGTHPVPPFRAETDVDLVDQFLPSWNEVQKEKIRPSVTLKLSGRDADGGTDNLEYSFKLDRSGWTPWSSNPDPVIQAGFMLWQGHHTLSVRARDHRYPASIDPTPASVEFITDFSSPVVSLMRDGRFIRVLAEDNVTPREELYMRYQVEGQPRSEWSKLGPIDALALGAFGKSVTVEVADAAGWVGEETRSFDLPADAVTTSATGAANVQSVPLKASSASKCGGAASGADCGESDDGCASTHSVSLLLMLLMGLLLAARRLGRPARASILGVAATLGLGLFSIGCDDSGSAPCVLHTDCGAGEMCLNGHCVDAQDGDFDSLSDIDMPDGDQSIEDDKPIDGDEPEESEAEEESPEDQPCGTDGTCPTCFYCNKRTNTCKKQLCETNPECGLPDCAESSGDSCSTCDMSAAAYQCRVPRCSDDNDCACRVCEGDTSAMCKASTGECICRGPCGGCPENSNCCAPQDTCKACPAWCEGVTCDPGYQPGFCDPATDATCAPGWTACESGWDPDTCLFAGPGRPGHPSCDCKEKPPLPIGYHGRFSDMAVNPVADQDGWLHIWLSAYNDTYGDLMVGRSRVRGALLDSIQWWYLDGVPEGALPEGGPSGPRGGVAEKGPNVGLHTSIALSPEGWPRIVYHDADTGNLVLIYTNGEPVTPADGDADAEPDAEIAPEEEIETADEGDGEPAEAAKTSKADTEPTYPEVKWTKLVVDDAGTTGYYTDIQIDSLGRPIIAYMMVKDVKGEDEVGARSALKLAMATTPNPTAASDFVLVEVDAAAIGAPYCEDADSCSKSKKITFGTGLNPSILIMPNGEFNLFYYHNTSYHQNGVNDDNVPIYDNVKYGNLMRSRLLGGPIDPSTLAGAGWSQEIFAGTPDTLVSGDVGLFHSEAVSSTTGWWVVSFYNATLNQLQFLYDFGYGTRLYTADDGWREDNHGTPYQVWLGADCSAAIGMDGIRIVYQDQTQGMLMYFSTLCMDGCENTHPVSITPKNLLTDNEGNAEEFGYSYGFYANQSVVGGLMSIVSNYQLNLYDTPNAIELKLYTAPPESSR